MMGAEIAVIGLDGRFPGAADADAYWRMLADGRVAIRRSSPEALLAAGFSDAALADPALVPAFGVLDGVDRFDGAFFGYPAARAELLDPQQRLLLECAWHALEDAGYGPGSRAAAASVIGTYLSMAGSSYAVADTDDLAEGLFALTSRDKDYAATRVSYKLDLTGPSMMVQTACSGSLAAVHLAVEALLGGQCDMAIAGGCSLTLPQGAYRQGPGLMLSASGRLLAFDAAADGAVPGNGLGIVVLKPLGKALADGDPVRAVILGSAMNNDGARKADYLAPSVRGQARAIGEALSVAEVDAASIGYLECHGTGTALGDPVEIRALAQAFAAAGGVAGSGRTALGAVKASIGHLNVASGIAGFIKTVLALQHRTLPPNPSIRSVNAEIDLGATPFALHAAPCEWEPIGGVRRAGVSSFGFGGTNVHVVLQEAPPATAPQLAEGAVVLPFSAKTMEALDRGMAAVADALAARPDLGLADIANTLHTGRQHFEQRRAVLCRDREAAIAALRRGGEGAAADWPQDGPVHAAGRRRVSLPGYAFAPTRHWRVAAAPRPAPIPVARPLREPGPDLARLQAIFGEVLNEDPASLDPDATYDRFGIDSLLIGSLTAALRLMVPSLRSTVLFEHDTLRRLAAHIAALGMMPDAVQVATPGQGAIAVIGLSGRYPGAPDIDALWRNLAAGRSAIREIPPERWDRAAHAEASRTGWGGFIDDVDRFDPLFFGIAPREAKLMDPQQRLFLQVAWAALEDAGYTRVGLKAAARGRDVGVFAGVMNQPYRLLGLAASAAGMVVQANHWSVANRISYHFDFGGPSLAVDTGCSASLTALHLACESLRRGECGVALAGGVNLILHPVQQIELGRTGVLARGQSCAVFGAAADGFVQGEGVGVAVLKPLDRALADGDVVHGVILGSAVNAGGKSSGYTVPRLAAQAAVVGAAIAAAGAAPDSIGYVECHGTATALGDPIEVAALADALRGAGRSRQDCTIGSVKSNIGHLEAAAGIAGLTKLLLQLQNGAFVPSLGAVPPNPAIDLSAGPFVVANDVANWPAPAGGVRRGGLSSFGAGGANAHMVVEQAPPRPPTAAAPGAVIVPLSARTPEALDASRERLAAWLDAQTGPAPGLLADLAYTLTVGREAMEQRAAYVLHDLAQLRAALRAGDVPRGEDAASRLAARWCAGEPADLALRFEGQGRRRVRLPSYTFARERCWLPEAAPLPPVPRGLLGPAIPVLAAEARWRVDLSPGHPVMAGHVVGGAAMLPGVASLELAAAAARALGRTGFPRFRDIRWLAPCTGATEPAEIVLRDGAGGLAFTLTRDATVLVSGGVEFGTGPDDPPAWPAEAAARYGRHWTGEQVYARLAELGLDYGAAFRAIRSLDLSDTTAVAEVAMDDPAWQGLALPPGMLDAVLQAAAMIVFAQPDAPRLLPMALDELVVLGEVPAGGRVHARLLDGGARDVARFDAALFDAEGRAALVFKGLTGRVDRTWHAAAAPSMPQPAPEALSWFYTPAWHPAPAPGPMAAPAAGGSVLLVSAAEVLVPPPGYRLIRLGSVEADPADVAGWQATLGAEVAELVVAFPSEPDEGEATLLQSFRALKALREARGDAPTRLVVLSRAGVPAVAASWAAAAKGLARVAAREWPGWKLVAATLDGWDDLASALADPGDPRGLELAWQGGVRHVRVLEPYRVDTAAAPAFRQGGAYLILGGGGGIGMELALHLARTRQARMALVGRRPATPAQEARMAQMRAAGGDAAYFVADATRPGELRRAVAEARARFGTLHGMIHAAIVMEDRSLELMSEATFRAGLDVKTRGTLALAEAAADAELDLLALFSSVNSFAANAGQANYVAGCAFKDAYGLALAARGLPVRVINWGFWGEVGRVADDAYRTRFARRGVQPIGTAEGIAAAEMLLAARLPQVVAVKAEARVLQRLGVTQGPLAAVQVAADLLRSAQASAMQAAAAAGAALDALSRRCLAAWWAGTGVLPRGEPLDVSVLCSRLGVVPRHQRLFEAMLDALQREGAILRDGDTLRAGDAGPAPDPDGFRRAHPDYAPHATLLAACANAYGDLLAGRVLATEVMFPNASMALVEGIYRGNRMSDFCNALVAEAVGTLVDAAAGRVGRPEPVRVLEVGAGTGGTSRAVIPRIAATPGLEYVYTDLSLAFVKIGQRAFGEMLPGLSCQVLDIGKEGAGQDGALGRSDVVLGANVVHATPDLARTLRTIRGLLRPGGALVLYELTALHDFGTLTFGLLDGWWNATDARMPHAPLLDVAAWRRVLAAAGFGEVLAFSEPSVAAEAEFRQSVIVAHNPAEPAAVERPAAAMRDRLRRRAEQAALPKPGVPASLLASISEVVAEVLEMRLEDVRTDCSFADFGTDSILGVTLVEMLGRRLGVPIGPTMLFSHQTVQKLAAFLVATHGAEALSPGASAAPDTPVPRPSSALLRTAPAAEPIAVIGWSGRFPGASDIATFWANAVAGVDSVGDVPPLRWDHAAILGAGPERTDCRQGGFLDGIEYFDPLFFGLSPSEAAAMDPQQRVFLEAAWHALEHAGYASASLDETATGVFVGTVAGDYEQRLRAAGRTLDAHSFMGTAPSMLAARIAYRLNLRGPCLSVDTACSSSLVAVHLACESLRRGESSLALAGGVAVMTTPAFFLAGASAGMLSPTGRCRTLDAAADGFVPAEATAAVVLKRLADARRDGDQILGVIRATGMNQDGASNGITAPNGAAQTALLRQVHAQAAIAPSSIGYVELHGTGTRLGDPIELGALADAFGPAEGRGPWCALGSAKANIGHALPAAGMVGLIRAMLVLRHGTIPPMAGFTALNRHIALEGTPFHVPDAALPWPAGATRAAVSAFGFSGTNAHVVVERAPEPASAPSNPGRESHLAVVSAETEVALQRRLSALAEWLGAHPDASIADVCFTLGHGRNRMRHRLAFRASDCAGLRQAVIARQAATDELAERWRAGEPIDWRALYPAGSVRRVGLPGYPFARRRCWPEAPSVFSAVLDALADEAV